MEGIRPRGGQRIKFMDTLLEHIGGRGKVVDLVKLSQKREGWHSMVDDVT